MAPSDQIQFQAQAIHDLLAGTSAEQMSNSTPCAKWQTRDLVEHLVGGGTMLGAALKGEPMAMGSGGPPPDLVGDDPVAAWDRAIQAFSEGVDSPGALEREITLPDMTMPGSMLFEIIKFDLLVHAWDLAKATDQAFEPPAEVVEPAMAAAEMIIAPEMRNGDRFGTEVTPPSDATQIERLAAFTGRAV